eukprot:TRINITY_DN5770_c0_g1_i1.p1 TRINITY_DN5770_c0_g1~~TRINITY_DN5770_c0_g1_i1.p1  ORF type:complete len:147 (-),score=37.40 TRINITY_DN5770_c0_g1_i1:25-465(-)
MAQVQEDTADELRKAFALFDKDKDGRVNIQELGRLMRHMSFNPTFAELEESLKTHGSAGLMDTTSFVNMMASGAQDTDNEKELVEAFQVFDKDGKGFISVMELRHVLGNMGEKLPESEVEQMLREAHISGDGIVSYAEFVRSMLNK